MYTEKDGSSFVNAIVIVYKNRIPISQEKRSDFMRLCKKMNIPVVVHTPQQEPPTFNRTLDRLSHPSI